jgi:hypothetical protein
VLLGGQLARDELKLCGSVGMFLVMSSAAESQVVSLAGLAILAWMRPSRKCVPSRPARGPSPDSHFRAALQSTD